MIVAARRSRGWGLVLETDQKELGEISGAGLDSHEGVDSLKAHTAVVQ